MAGIQTPQESQWEQDYKDKLGLLAQITQARGTKNGGSTYDGVSGGQADASSSTINTGTGTTVSTPIGNIIVPKEIPSATIKNGIVLPPKDIDRKQHQLQLYGYLQSMTPTSFAHVNESLFSFPHPEENMFMPHFAAILNLVHATTAKLLGVDKLVVSSGLRKEVIAEAKRSGVEKIDAHMAGIAADFALTGQARYTFANACWSIGIRAIGMGMTHVHIDSGPEEHWSEGDGAPIYYGPN